MSSKGSIVVFETNYFSLVIHTFLTSITL